MFTCQEHLEHFELTRQVPNPLWVHALDALKHVLKGENQSTFYKSTGDERKYLDELRSYLDGKPKEVDSFLDAKHNTFVEERKWRRFDSECGDLSTERYLDGEPRPFDDYRKVFINKPAVTIVLDATICYAERDGSEMVKRHEQVYKYACQANKEGRPCRVVAVECCDLAEANHFRSFFVLKDFDDPIFPAIWAAFETNKLTNSWINSFMDYFIGTHSYGNGTCVSYDTAKDFPEETILVKPKTWTRDSRQKEDT